ncbi:MAG: 23S rRNA (adenine(2503)-C(2))-methyltransferase RlmN [Candidatus Omnitrophica bacterium]|nr:23S rRNA (adenine(2503)-C(2))-methyltransferase RlmN [Candidatus Omnitrophota bacterium]
MDNIYNLSLQELEEILAKWAQPVFHARQIFSWLYQKQAPEFSAMSNLSADLRRRLEENFYLGALQLVKAARSTDGTEKFLLELKDKHLIEAVLIPAEKRLTGCISTQVGCRFSCRLCASGLAGFKRNLTSGEMIEQVLYLKNNSRARRLTHLVFMGMGEPLDNYDQLLKAIRVINSASGLDIGARRMTISTCGIVPGIKKLAQEKLQVELSISLHAADQEIRSQLMPVNKIYPLAELIAACRQYIRSTRRQITFEYALIQGINSDLQMAEKLGKIVKSLKLCKVNLIPCNLVGELKVKPPDKLAILLFCDYLRRLGINVTLRKPRGQDIEGACGQLRLRYEKK